MYCARKGGSLQVASPGALGFEPVSLVAAVSALNPAQWFGTGRREADIITADIQPKIGRFLAETAGRLGVNVYGCGEIPASVPYTELAQAGNQVEQLRGAFLAFLRDTSIFSDGRASGQAANTEMPKFDGTADYGDFASGGRSVSNLPVTTYTQMIVGAVPTGVAYTGAPVCGGLLGAIDRAVTRAGSTAQSAPAPSGVAPAVFTQVPEDEAPWWQAFLPAPAPAADSSTRDSSSSNGYAPGLFAPPAGGGGGGGGPRLPAVQTAGVAEGPGGGLTMLLLLGAVGYMATRKGR